MTLRAPAAWIRVALAMFAVGWGANQFSPMLIVYRQALGLGAAEIAGLFGIYAATLIPGLLAGLSDRFGRRACVLPFAALSPVATLLLILGPHDLAPGGRAACRHGVRPGDLVRTAGDLSGGRSRAPRGARAERRDLVVPYLPHLVLGVVALAAVWTVPDVRRAAPARGGRASRLRTRAVRSRRPRRSCSARCRWRSSCFPRR